MYQANLARFGMELGATGWRAPDPHLQEQLRRVYLPDIRVDRRPPRNSSSKGSPSNSRAIVPWKSTHPLRPSLPHKPGAGNALESGRSEEHTSELQSLMRISYAVFCLKKNNKTRDYNNTQIDIQYLSREQTCNRTTTVTHTKI